MSRRLKVTVQWEFSDLRFASTTIATTCSWGHMEHWPCTATCLSAVLEYVSTSNSDHQLQISYYLADFFPNFPLADFLNNSHGFSFQYNSSHAFFRYLLIFSVLFYEVYITKYHFLTLIIYSLLIFILSTVFYHSYSIFSILTLLIRSGLTLTRTATINY